MILREEQLYVAWNNAVREILFGKIAPVLTGGALMYAKNGIAYAGDQAPVRSVVAARPLNGHKLSIHFTDGSRRVVDLAPCLRSPAFLPLIPISDGFCRSPADLFPSCGA